MSGTNLYVLRAERVICLIKKRERCIESSVPWKLSLRLVKCVVAFMVSRLNALPRRSIDPIAPMDLLAGRRFDAVSEATLGFRDYAQV